MPPQPPARKSGESPALRARDGAIRGDLLYQQGKFTEALDEFRQCIRLQPDVPDFHFRVANAAWKLEDGPRVEKHFLEAVRLDPRFAEAHKMLGQWFIKNEQVARALHHSTAALALAPKDADTIVTHAVCLHRDGQLPAAWALLTPLVDSGYADRHLAMAYAGMARKLGHEAQAAAVIERALLDPKLTVQGKRQLHVAIVALLEVQGKFDDAFNHMRAAKELVRLPFDPAVHSRWISAQIDYFTEERLRSHPRASHKNRRPVLIVGMPRSGTSLIEQILASHPDVFGGGELRLMGNLVDGLALSDRAKTQGLPYCLQSLSVPELNRLADPYLAGIKALNSTARYVTDKLPKNCEFLGFVDVLLPECHVIHCARDPRDTCLSCYFTDFDEGIFYTQQLSHLASYYRDYRRLMAHWKKALTVPMLEVRYEEVVNDLEGQARRMLAFLDLPWDERCLAFHQNKREVATASRFQVRSPLYSTSVGRWKNYEEHIPQIMELAREEQVG